MRRKFYPMNMAIFKFFRIFRHKSISQIIDQQMVVVESGHVVAFLV